MGFARGSEIFSNLGHLVAGLHQSRQVSYVAGVHILEHVARNLSAEDWDTEDESYSEFRDNPMVVQALRRAFPDREWYDEEDEDDEPMSAEERRRFESRPDFPGWEAL